MLTGIDIKNDVVNQMYFVNGRKTNYVSGSKYG